MFQSVAVKIKEASNLDQMWLETIFPKVILPSQLQKIYEKEDLDSNNR